MKFFHVYNEDCFKGLEKNNLINEDTGFKIQHCFAVPEDFKFNRFAAKGSKLYNLIKSGGYPFYVDRIAGGITYHKYDFDFELIAAYKELLGDWFLGFQMHESASNRVNEWRTILSRMGSKGPYDLDEFKEKMTRTHAVMPDGTVLPALSHDTPEFFFNKTYPETVDEAFAEMIEMFGRRIKDTNHNVLPCDSYYMATKFQDELGMRSFMPEIGCQIPLTRLALSIARGMAKAKGKIWGAYYECWRYVPGVGYSMPCFNSDPGNEWYLTQELHPDDFTSHGKNGGSSRLLQNRIYYYSLMSGADYFSEEWGLNCSYSDMKEFTLSDYGKVKKDFIDTALTLRGIKAITPFAIVLPKAYACVQIPEIEDVYEFGIHRDTYLSKKIDEGQKAYYGHVEDVLKLIFQRNGDVWGNEGHVMTNSRFGDVFDVIYEDAPMEAFKNYEYLIDASPDNAFYTKMSESGLKVLKSDDLGYLENTLPILIKEVMPCNADGLHWLCSGDSAGRRYLSIFNNEGNERDLGRGDIIHPEADKRIKVEFKNPGELVKVKEGYREAVIEKADDNTYYVTVPAASFVIVEY